MLINGKEYAWCVVKVMLNGVPLEQVITPVDSNLFEYYKRLGHTYYFRGKYNNFKVELPDEAKKFFKKGQSYELKIGQSILENRELSVYNTKIDMKL